MARNVIALLGSPIVNEDDEAAEAITPGHLVAFDGSGNLIKNTANADDVARAFALERDEMGDGIDVAYAIGDTVKVGVFAPGMRVYAFVASGQNVAKGDALTGSATAGLLTKTGVADGVRLARALEAVNTTGSSPVAGTRIRVEIL